jgi:hypothetical protein
MAEEKSSILSTSLIIFLVFIAFLILGVATYSIFQAFQSERTDITDKDEGPSPTLSQTTESVSEMGRVEGIICYPSEFVPEGYILAKNVATEETKRKYFKGVPPGDQTYSLELEPGTYVFAYELGGSPAGFYTPCALFEINSCQPPESHRLKEVEVKAGQTVEEINICDYYYGENKPDF